MARLFRLWEKKRGTRRTGSQWLGGVGEALFFAALLLIGTVSLTALITIQLLHSAGDSAYLSGWSLLLVGIVVTSLIVIGGGGLFYAAIEVGASAERRSALVKKATNIEILRDALPSSNNYPNVPRDTNLTNSPGVQLAYRLPIAGAPAWKFFFAAVIWLASIGVASVLAVWAADGFQSEPREMYRAFVATPFLVIGIVVTLFFARLLFMLTSLGPTSVEISDHPLLPGESYDIYLSQGGQVSVHSFEVNLVCEEEATYQQGTNIRTEKRQVYDQSVFRRDEFQIKPGSPFESRCQLEMPQPAMHSFKSPSNAIYWKLVVRADTDGWPAFERSFPVVVYPGNNNHARPDQPHHGTANQPHDSRP